MPNKTSGAFHHRHASFTSIAHALSHHQVHVFQSTLRYTFGPALSCGATHVPCKLWGDGERSVERHHSSNVYTGDSHIARVKVMTYSINFTTLPSFHHRWSTGEMRWAQAGCQLPLWQCANRSVPLMPTELLQLPERLLSRLCPAQLASFLTSHATKSDEQRATMGLSLVCNQCCAIFTTSLLMPPTSSTVLTTVATNSLFSARVSQLQGVGGAERELARLPGGKARYAARWKTVRPTETAYRLSDEFYRYSARRDLGLPPTRDRVLQHRCGSCRMGILCGWLSRTAMHSQQRLHKLRHDSIERLLHDIIRDGVGLAYRQQHGLPAADRTIPDLLIYLDNQAFLCDVTVTDTLADGNLAHSKQGPGCLAEKKAEKKERKYSRVAREMRAVHLPFAVETMGGLSKSALQLVREIHHSASTHCTWRNADAIGSHLLDCVAIAVQRCTGMALRASVERETTRALGARAA